MRYWWCNQSQCFEVESAASVVQASCVMNSVRYRETVSEVLSGDISVHYHKRKGVVAISRAKENAEGIVLLPNLGGLPYERGWRFPAEYFLFSRPIPKPEWIDTLIPKTNDPDWPVNSNGNIKQAYFVPFSRAGYEAIIQQAQEPIPQWGIPK